MKMKEKLSINEFDGKKFKEKAIEPDDYNKAVLTHYLHNIENGVAKHYEKDEKKYLEDFVNYKNKSECLKIVSDIALQQLLF